MKSPELPSHDVRILRAFLRSEELRRDRFLREIDAVRSWKPLPDDSQIAYWIAEVTLRRWEDELAAVDRSIGLIREKMKELEALRPPASNQKG
jgi:hypothetical protein